MTLRCWVSSNSHVFLLNTKLSQLQGRLLVHCLLTGKGLELGHPFFSLLPSPFRSLGWRVRKEERLPGQLLLDRYCLKLDLADVYSWLFPLVKHFCDFREPLNHSPAINMYIHTHMICPHTYHWGFCNTFPHSVHTLLQQDLGVLSYRLSCIHNSWLR